MPNLPDVTGQKSQAKLEAVQHEVVQHKAPQHHESSEAVKISQSDAEQRLRQAAHILANGAIRAALKQRAQQAEIASKPCRPKRLKQPETLQNAPLPDVLNTDIVSSTESPTTDNPPTSSPAMALTPAVSGAPRFLI